MSGQILKIEEIEFTDKFCLEPKRRKDTEDNAWSFWLITERRELPLFLTGKIAEGQISEYQEFCSGHLV